MSKLSASDLLGFENDIILESVQRGSNEQEMQKQNITIRVQIGLITPIHHLTIYEEHLTEIKLIIDTFCLKEDRGSSTKSRHRMASRVSMEVTLLPRTT